MYICTYKQPIYMYLCTYKQPIIQVYIVHINNLYTCTYVTNIQPNSKSTYVPIIVTEVINMKGIIN